MVKMGFNGASATDLHEKKNSFLAMVDPITICVIAGIGLINILQPFFRWVHKKVRRWFRSYYDIYESDYEVSHIPLEMENANCHCVGFISSQCNNPSTCPESAANDSSILCTHDFW